MQWHPFGTHPEKCSKLRTLKTPQLGRRLRRAFLRINDVTGQGLKHTDFTPPSTVHSRSFAWLCVAERDGIVLNPQSPFLTFLGASPPLSLVDGRSSRILNILYPPSPTRPVLSWSVLQSSRPWILAKRTFGQDDVRPANMGSGREEPEDCPLQTLARDINPRVPGTDYFHVHYRLC